MKLKILSDKNAQASALNQVLMLVSVAIGLVILAVVLVIGPVVGYNIESSNVIPSTGAAGAVQAAMNWNTNNTAILNGSEIWAQDTPLLGSAAIVVIASIIIAVLLGAFMLKRT